MRGLFDLDLGADAVVVPGPLGLVRRVRHHDVALVVDTPDEVGLVLNLSDAHRVEGRMAGTRTRGIPRTGSVTVMPPGCRFDFTIAGACRVLTLRLPWSAVVRAAEEAGDDASRAELRPCVNTEDATLARRIYAALVDDDGARDATQHLEPPRLSRRLNYLRATRSACVV